VGGTPETSDDEFGKDEYGRFERWRWIDEHASIRPLKKYNWKKKKKKKQRKAPDGDDSPPGSDAGSGEDSEEDSEEYEEETPEEYRQKFARLGRQILMSEMALVASVNIIGSVEKSLPTECFDTRFGLDDQFNGFPRITFLQAWNEDSDVYEGAFDERKAAFTELMQADARFGGYKVVNGEQTTQWVSDPMMLATEVSVPEQACFARADYGGLIVKSLLKWRCLPPIYARHTLKASWFEAMDQLDARLWTKPARPPPGMYFEDFNTNYEISVGMELRKLFESVESMIKTVKARVDTHVTSDLNSLELVDTRFMDVVDEIYMTEQLCNFFYGIRYLIDKERLKKGEWASWSNDLVESVNAYSFVARSEEYYKLPNDVRTYVLYPELISSVWDMVTTLMKTCVAVDFRLPYLRIKELRSSYNQREDVWPGPGAGSVSDRLMPREFPEEINI
jgi:hypothetical protein